MKCRFISIFLFCLCSLAVCAQEFSYTHYDSKDGLASATVYSMTQDKEGFLWFATESGLSRFDGTHFRSFYHEDGLPDNDVIKIFADSKGRVWISPFKKTVCYYYKGKIYNNENDPLLRKLQLKDNVVRFAEDNDGNILLQDRACLHMISSTGKVTRIQTNGYQPLGYISLVASRAAGGFWVLMDDKIYILNDQHFTLYKTIDYPQKHYNFVAIADETLVLRARYGKICFRSMNGNHVSRAPFLFSSDFINLAVIDRHEVAYCTQGGAILHKLAHSDSVSYFLKGVPISNVFKDSEGSVWFCTLGKGVYRLNSAIIRQYPSKAQDNKYIKSPVLQRSVKWGNTAKAFYLIRQYSAQKGKEEELTDFTWSNFNPRVHLITLPDNKIVVGTHNNVAKLSSSLDSQIAQLNLVSAKAFCMHQNALLMATDKEIVRIDPATFKITDTLWPERTTCLFSNNATIYAGTLNGLCRLDPETRKMYFLGGDCKALQGRITAIQEDSNKVIWVATAGDGLVAWKNGAVIKHFTRYNGLTSSSCRALFLKNGILWVGTNKGLNKVEVLRAGFPVERYTISDGLASDDINAIYARDKKVFVGTMGGITYIDEEKMSRQSRCDLRFTGITIDGETFDASQIPATIAHAKNNIRFNYVGISFKSNGDIRYRYRLLGLDSNWNETRETFLSYPTLPSGEYQLQVQAINKFDVISNLLTTSFTIEKLLHEKIWFQLLMGVLFLVLTGLIVLLIIRRIRKREGEKTAFVKRINELEQLSRKAQMNPHFIFNSLNSIQQYVMDSDVAGANKFISGFSRLIRQTLDFSSRHEISLEEELDYLANYLELEKTRLENPFSYKVIIDEAVEPADHYIPPMILQPFVENSVRHGLRYRRDKNGIVTISVNREGDYLICILEDNGVGRKAAMEYKSISPINYQSKGLSLTADRIEMFNREHQQQITMRIDDLEDDHQQASGTRVTISFPVL